MAKKTDRDEKVRSKHDIPEDTTIWHAENGWATYRDGLISVKMMMTKQELIPLQDISELEYKAPSVLTRGHLRFTRAADTFSTRQELIFTKGDQESFAELKTLLESDRKRGVTGELPADYGPGASRDSIRADYIVPDSMTIWPAGGKQWVAYGDGLVSLKMLTGPVLTIPLQDIVAIELKPQSGFGMGHLRLKRSADNPTDKLGNSPHVLFAKEFESSLIELRDLLESDREKGVTGIAPVMPQPEIDPSADLKDQAFRYKYGIPTDAVLARTPGSGYVAFDGHYVVIQHIGLGRFTIGKGVKRIPVTSISSIQIKPAGILGPGFIQFSLPGGNELKSKFGRQAIDAADDENSMLIGANEPAYLALRDAIEQAQRDLHQPRQVQQAAPDDVFAQLEKLGKLRDAGILSDAEFDTKKAELLDRM